MILTTAYRVTFHLGRTFYMLTGKVMIIFCIIIFAKRNSTAFAVDDFTVLNDPAIGPVRTHHAVLISCRRCPGRSCFFNIKAGQGDEIHVLFTGHKALPADIDLNLFLTRILSLEVRINNSFITLALRIPLVSGPLVLPGRFINRSMIALCQSQRLIHRFIIQIDASCVTLVLRKIPVPINRRIVRIVVIEYSVRNVRNPYILAEMLPVLHFLRTTDDCSKRLHGPIYDPVFCRSAMDGIHILPVNTGQNQHFIPRHRNLRRIVDSLKRPLL